MRKLILLLIHVLVGSILIISGLIGPESIFNKILLGIIGIFFAIGIWGHVKEIGIGGVADE